MRGCAELGGQRLNPILLVGHLVDGQTQHCGVDQERSTSRIGRRFSARLCLSQ
jgi:hypothetical protein